MLAIGRPALASHFGMSSHQVPGKDENPFGYTFTTEDIDNAAAEENITAAGPPLLSDVQFNQLQNFFDQGPFNAFTNNFNFSDADLQSTADPSGAFNFSFFDEPPPTFHGTVPETTQGHSMFAELDRQPGSGYTAARNNDAQGGPSDEVIGAATALLSSSQPPPDLTYAEKPWGNFMGLPSPPASAAFTSGADQRSMTAAAGVGDDNKAMIVNFFDQTRAAPMANSSSGSSRPRPGGVPRFGSDSSFQGNGFMASSKRDSETVVWDRLLGDMSVLQPSDSTPNTRPGTQPSSPTLQKRPSAIYASYEESMPHLKQPNSPKRPRLPLSLIPIEPTPAASDDESASDDELSPGSRPQKRRRTIQENGFPSRSKFGDVTPTTNSQRAASFSVAARPKKPRDSATETLAKRKSGSKQPRENLSEEQKRSNHILSEQKRRNLIKQGFEELNELVPGLKAGGFSKSSTLMEGAKFLENLVVGNQILRQALGEV